MPEQQNMEYKSSWHDDYLKCICGFANAQDGRIYIGKDDDGKIIGVEDYKHLMDDIPNKINNASGKHLRFFEYDIAYIQAKTLSLQHIGTTYLVHVTLFF
jgi:predicted HTH transcriptional regulator